MRTKDFISMEQAYQVILEAKESPCPCTVGKKCKKEDCDCTKCKKDKTVKEMHEEDPKEKHLSDPKIQKGMSILQQYAQGDISNLEAAQMFKDLYENGSEGPSQDDLHYTHN